MEGDPATAKRASNKLSGMPAPRRFWLKALVAVVVGITILSVMAANKIESSGCPGLMGLYGHHCVSGKSDTWFGYAPLTYNRGP